MPYLSFIERNIGLHLNDAKSFKRHSKTEYNAFTQLKQEHSQSRTQSMPVRRLGAGHDSGKTEYRISNFGYTVSSTHALAQTAILNSRGRH
jgi:hypothetical protein